ncbi:FMN reductase [Streptomyces sp. NPDC060194]|uniref:FMN reductase n=1 Tax=Streptomyces sp. NPDC060194 TaxID=3347069 RepID=UPI003649AAB5
MKLTVVSAGLSTPSSTRLLADRLADSVRAQLPADREGATVEVVELRELARGVADHLVTGFPSPRLAAAVEAVTSADGLVAVTPVFTASYSGLFKSFFDLVDPDALTGTPVLIGATGGTARHSLVLEHALRPLFASLRSVVVPTAVYAASQDWGAGGDAWSEGLPARVRRAGGELAALMSARATRPGPDGEDGVTVPERRIADLRLD